MRFQFVIGLLLVLVICKAQPSGQGDSYTDPFADMSSENAGQALTDSLSSGQDIQGTAPPGTTFSTPSGTDLTVSGEISIHGGMIDAADISSDWESFTEVQGLTYDGSSFTASSADRIERGDIVAEGATGISGDEDSISFDHVASLDFRATDVFQLRNIDGLVKSGDTIYVRKGEIVIDGTDSYHNIKDSKFRFKDGRISHVDVISDKDGNAFIIKGTSIVVDEDDGLSIGFSAGSLSATVNGEILFRNILFLF
jgi:hypothetical protein